MTTTHELHWPSAEATGVRLVRPGPRVSDDQARRAVDDLYRYAREAQPLVRETARIDVPMDTAPVVVADRTAWLRANVEALSSIVPTAPEPSTTGRLAGAQIGAVLAWLSTKVLGQFDIFAPADVAPDGRLLLVAPNIVAAEIQLEVDPQDFRLWVCLHEETHRVQFTAFPWLRDYLRGQAEALTGLTDQATIAKLDLVKAFTSREGRRGSLLDYLPQSEELRDSIGQVTAVMSLLEGHADVIMDRVGPQVIGSVHQIRERFEVRRNSRSGFDRIVGQLLGMDVKLAQYRDGARFCRHVIDSRGIEMLNLALFSPETLPTLPEIHQPGLWVARMDATVG